MQQTKLKLCLASTLSRAWNGREKGVAGAEAMAVVAMAAAA